MAAVSEQVGPDDGLLMCGELTEVSLPPSLTCERFFLPSPPDPEVPRRVGDR